MCMVKTKIALHCAVLKSLLLTNTLQFQKIISNENYRKWTMFKISKLIYKLYIQYNIYSTIILNVDRIGMPSSDI